MSAARSDRKAATSFAAAAQISGGTGMPEAVIALVKESYDANKQVCFDGDNYDEAWHEEAEERGDHATAESLYTTAMRGRSR